MNLYLILICSKYCVLDVSLFISILFESFNCLFIIKTQSFSIFCFHLHKKNDLFSLLHNHYNGTRKNIHLCFLPIHFSSSIIFMGRITLLGKFSRSPWLFFPTHDASRRLEWISNSRHYPPFPPRISEIFLFCRLSSSFNQTTNWIVCYFFSSYLLPHSLHRSENVRHISYYRWTLPRLCSLLRFHGCCRFHCFC